MTKEEMIIRLSMLNYSKFQTPRLNEHDCNKIIDFLVEQGMSPPLTRVSHGEFEYPARQWDPEDKEDFVEDMKKAYSNHEDAMNKLR